MGTYPFPLFEMCRSQAVCGSSSHSQLAQILVCKKYIHQPSRNHTNAHNGTATYAKAIKSKHKATPSTVRRLQPYVPSVLDCENRSTHNIKIERMFTSSHYLQCHDVLVLQSG